MNDALAKRLGPLTIANGEGTLDNPLDDDDHVYTVREAFDEQVNDLLDDPIIDPDALTNQEDVVFGIDITEEDFDQLISLAQLTYRIGVPKHDRFDTVIACHCDEDGDEEAYLDGENDDGTPEALQPILFAIIEHCRPTGWTFEHNDNAINRKSGYNLNRSLLTFASDDAGLEFPVREQVQAHRLLIEKAAVFGLDLRAEVEAFINAARTGSETPKEAA